MVHLNETHRTFFQSLGIKSHQDPEQLREYGHDETEDYVFPPELVLLPTTVEEVSAIVT